MAVDSDFLLTALLCHNYLPTSRRNREELPPNFTSNRFTPDVAKKLAPFKRDGVQGFDQIEYRLTRFNTAGRWLSIPHPLPHAKLCLTLSEHWDKFDRILKNTHSNIKPQRYEDGRVIVMNGYSDSSEKTARHLNYSFGKRYVVHADVSNCFPSLYSHAIPWALVGFKKAKDKSGPKHRDEWFNQIDECVRHTRRNETQGVAIGPATSNILGEIILGKVDEALATNEKVGANFSRYIDDYSYYCDSEEDAKKFLHSLECELAKFKLQLNAKKTSIEKLPQPSVEPWVIALGQSMHFDKEKEVALFDVYRYLDFAQVLSAKYPEGSVLKYAVSTVIKMPIRWDSAGNLLQYLLSLSFHHTNLLPLLEMPIEKNHGDFFAYSRAGADLISILEENVSLKRSDGICWALYFLGRLEHHVPKNLAKKIVGTGDCMSILSLYWAEEEHRQLVVDYANSIDKAHLYELDRHWMLLYQMFFDSLIDNPYAADLTFQTLRDKGVSFLLDRKPYTGALAIFPAKPQEEPK